MDCFHFQKKLVVSIYKSLLALYRVLGFVGRPDTPFNFLHGLPGWLSDKESTCQFRRCGFNSWVGKICWRRKWLPTPIYLSGKSHRQRSLMSYSPWGCKRVEHDFMTKQQQQQMPFLLNCL